MSGYLIEPNVTDGKGEALLHRNLPLTSMTYFTPSYGNGSLLFKSIRNAIADTIIVSSPDGTADAVYRNETPIAQECILAWCVKTVRSSFAWGGYIEEIIETHYNTTPGPFHWEANYTSDEYENYTDTKYRESVHIDLKSSLYGTSDQVAAQTIFGFMDIFPGMTTAQNASATPQLRYKIWNDGEPWTMLLEFNPWMAPNNVTEHMQRLATALTNTIRSAKGKQVFLQGDAYAREVFIQIHWLWLIFPLFLAAMSLVFLVLTMRKTATDSSGAGIWKTSAMPALIYGLPKETQGKMMPSAQSQTREESKKIRIKLSPRVGWRVSGQSLRQMAPVLPVPQQRNPPPGWV